MIWAPLGVVAALCPQNPSIQWLCSGFDVGPLTAALDAHPDLWNRHTLRTAGYSPHTQVADIWARYNHIDNIGPEFNEEHESVWYPCVELLPVKPLVFDVMRVVEGEQLGGVLITKIPPGGEVAPHVDRGWHASHYEKFAVQLKGSHEQCFYFENSQLSAQPGDLYTFDNSKLHWVKNDSDVDRITLIICIRRSIPCLGQ